jgi:LPS export ABC transporter protein LptC
MNINLFFLFIIALLISILTIFKPIKDLHKESEMVAMLEIDAFKLYELDSFGLRSSTEGSYAKRYVDFYEIENVHYISKKDSFLQNISADFGKYNSDELTLKSNVKYVRDDGLNFSSDQAKYLVSKEIMTTDGKFHINQKSDHIYGSDLYYNIKTKEISAKNIIGNFVIKE